MTSDAIPYRESDTGEVYDASVLEERLATDNRSDDVIEQDSYTRDGKRKYSKGVLVVVGLVAMAFGIWLDHNVVTPPVYVYGPAPTVTVTEHEREVIHDTVNTVPESCRETITLIDKMTPYLKTVLGSSGKISDILSQARVAITMQDHKGLVKASDQNNQIANDMASASNNLLDLMQRYDIAVQQCLKDLG